MTIQRDSLADPTDPVPCPQNIVTPAHVLRRAPGARRSCGRSARLTVLVNSLSGVPGRKALLHVSDGLPLNPGEELFQFLLELCGGQRDRRRRDGPHAPENPGGSKFGPDKNPDASTVYDPRSLGPKSYQAASQAMLDAQTLQRRQEPAGAGRPCQRPPGDPLHPAGLRAAGADASDASAGPEDRLFQFPSIGTSQRTNHQDSLQLLADDTGGRSILDANDFLPDLARMREDLASFYSLGFTPAHTGDGREHRLEVRVKRPGLRLRYRQSYRDKPAIEKVVDRTLAALFYGIEDNPLEIAIEIGEPRRRRRASTPCPSASGSPCSSWPS